MQSIGLYVPYLHDKLGSFANATLFSFALKWYSLQSECYVTPKNNMIDWIQFEIL